MLDKLQVIKDKLDSYSVLIFLTPQTTQPTLDAVQANAHIFFLMTANRLTSHFPQIGKSITTILISEYAHINILLRMHIVIFISFDTIYYLKNVSLHRTGMLFANGMNIKGNGINYKSQQKKKA